jgi:hypothetical protein
MPATRSTASPPVVLGRWWFGRFELRALGEMLHFRDALVPPVKVLPRSTFAGLSGRDLLVAYFRLGFIRPALSSVPFAVRDRPLGPEDGMFWQYPGRTEAAAWDLHEALPAAGFDGTAMDVYVGMPWATWIDKLQKLQWSERGQEVMQQQVRLMAVRLSGYRHALASVGLRLRVHTVCQHIAWRKLLDVWRRIGVTDLWISHCEPGASQASGGGPRLHPWRLFAVNVEDPTRRTGLRIGRDPGAKPLLASFVGAHAPHYISDIRLRIRVLADEADMVILLRDEWHLERAVYREQVLGTESQMTPLTEVAAVREYNRLLSDSRFILCPAGAGPNTLRLWEALAVGAVPVLLGPPPQLPSGGNLPRIDWESILVRESGDNLADLPRRLRSMSTAEVCKRSHLARRAFDSVQSQACFA